MSSFWFGRRAGKFAVRQIQRLVIRSVNIIATTSFVSPGHNRQELVNESMNERMIEWDDFECWVLVSFVE